MVQHTLEHGSDIQKQRLCEVPQRDLDWPFFWGWGPLFRVGLKTKEKSPPFFGGFLHSKTRQQFHQSPGRLKSMDFAAGDAPGSRTPGPAQGAPFLVSVGKFQSSAARLPLADRLNHGQWVVGMIRGESNIGSSRRLNDG